MELLTLEFIQKYLQMAKKKTPKLTEEARQAIVEAYNGETESLYMLYILI